MKIEHASKHCSWSISWIGSVMVVEIAGNLNLRCSIEIEKALIEQIKVKPSERWCRLETTTEVLTLGTPEAYETLNRSLHYNIKNGCCALGVHGMSDVGKSLIKKECDKLALEFHSFDDIEYAIEFLTMKLGS